MRRSLAILGLIISLPAFAIAQKSILTGTVYDRIGAVIANVRVVAMNEKGDRFETLTDEEGVFVMKLPYFANNLTHKSTKYEITVDLTAFGFKKFVLKDFTFVPSTKGKMYLDIGLEEK